MQRDITIDCARGIGILLVVAGHAQGPWPLEKAIYSFHMPLFFLLSGYMSRNVPFGTLARSKASSLLVPYVLACLLTFLVFGGGLNASASDWQRLVVGLATGGAVNSLPFNSPMWFLPCLFSVFLIHYVLSQLGPNPTVTFGLSLIPAVLVHSLPHMSVMSIMRLDTALLSLPFFCLGVVMRGIETSCGKIPFRVPLLHTIPTAWLLLASTSLWVLARFLDHNTYYIMAHNKVFPLVWFYLNGLAGSVMVYSFSGLLVATSLHTGWLLKGVLLLSGPSFGIYLLHKPFIQAVAPMLCGLESYPGATFILNFAVGIGASLGSVFLLQRYLPGLGRLLLGNRLPHRSTS